MDLGVIFLTGLTTGGLTCLAVQAGLLTTALMKQDRVAARMQDKQVIMTGVRLPRTSWPVVYFLLAKLAAYTVLGFLLGALGSVFQITPTAQAFIQLGVGLFMLATALNMLNAHPIFRYFVIQPPKALTRLVRNQARSQDVFAPVILGMMTIFIPCGTTQAMEVLAISSGSPVLGSLILFVFVLGTSPTFLVLGFLASRLRGQLQSLLTTAAVLLIVFLGILSLDSGLTLLGSPFAPRLILASVFQSSQPTPAELVDGVQIVTITVSETSYSPNYIWIQKEYPVQLRLVTSRNNGCTRMFVVPSLRIAEILPETGEVTVNLPSQLSGSIYFTCSMGMYSGIIEVV